MVYVTNHHSDTVTNDETRSIYVGLKPYSIAVNPNTNLVYVANSGSGKVTVIDGNTNNEIKTLLWVHFLFISVNSKTNTVYVANRDANTTLLYQKHNNTLLDFMGIWRQSVATISALFQKN